MINSIKNRFFNSTQLPRIKKYTPVLIPISLGGAYWNYRNSRTCLASVTSSKPPSTTDKSSPDIKEEQGILKADLPRLIQTMGASMYGGSIAETGVKELLQNAFDGIKEAVHKGLITEGDIKIFFNANDRSITIEDNGIGMTPEIVREAFFTMGKSHKEVPPHLCSGGYGQAKIAFLLGVEKISLQTTRDGITTETTATPSELLENNFKIRTLQDSKTKQGTTVKIWIRDRYSPEKPISFNSSWDQYPALTAPLIGPTKITVSNNETSQVLNSSLNFNMTEHTTVNFDWGTATIYFDPSRKPNSMDAKHYILCSGIFQFTHRFKNDDRNTHELIPYDIIVDIKPNVFPDNARYPFTNNREAFRASIEEDIKKLTIKLRQIRAGKENAAWNRILSRASCMEQTEWKPLLESNPPTSALSRIWMAFQSTNPSERPINKESLTQCDGPIFINTVDEDFAGEGPNQKETKQFFHELGSIYFSMKEAMGKSNCERYRKIFQDNYYAGVLICHGFHGFQIPDPIRAVVVNPLSSYATTVDGMCRVLIETMIHELAHINEGYHGVSHNQEMERIMVYLADQGVLMEVEKRLKTLLDTHKELLLKMKERFSKAKSVEKIIGIS